MEYVPGNPVLIKNMVTQLKSQGIFDQFRKECIADVDTKPAYQNLCHLADNQVSKFLSKVKWGPDSHKNQIRENLRRQLNECSFVEPGIAIIVDQLVNPRINTVLVPKVEDMLYKYLGIPRETHSDASRRDYKPFNDRKFNAPNSMARSYSTQESVEKIKDHEKPSFYSGADSSKSFIKTDTVTSRTQVFADKSSRDARPSIKIESADIPGKDIGKPGKSVEIEKREIKMEEKELVQPSLDSESSDEEMSPPYEPNEKSDNDMSIGSGSSNFSEIIDPKTLDADIPIEQEIENICKTEESKIITEHEDSMDSVRSHNSIHSVPEKIIISPIEIPKTPTIHYETSEDSDDNLKNKKLAGLPTEPCTEPLDIPEVNFDKIAEKVIEDNADDVKPFDKADVAFEPKPIKEEEASQKPKEKSRTDDAKKKHKPDDKSKSIDTKEKSEKKQEHRSDKDRSKHDKHKSEHRSKDRDKDKLKHDSKSHRKDDRSHHSKERDHKSDHDKKAKSDHRKDDKSEHKIEPKKDDKGERKKDEKFEHKKDDKSDRKKDDKDHKKDDKSEHKKDDKKHDDDKKHSRDDKERKKDSRKSTSDDKRSKSKSDDFKYKHDKPKDDKKPKDGDHSKNKKKDDETKKSRSHCNVDEKKKTDRRSSDRDSSGPSASNSSHSTTHHSSKSDKDKGSSRHRHSSSSSSSHKTKKNDNLNDREKDRGKASESAPKLDKNLVDKLPEDDLELILESSPEKAFGEIKTDVNFAKKVLQAETSIEDTQKGNDHIEDMMNEIFQPTSLKPIDTVPEAPAISVASAPVTKQSIDIPKPDPEPLVLKKPKIAKNFADIRRIMKLRKMYKESFKIKEEQGKENTSTGTTVNESLNQNSTPNQMKLRKTVDYFVTRRFGKNGSNVDKCKELTNAIMETLTGVKLNITRVDRRYPIVDGTCKLNDEKKIDENGLPNDGSHIDDVKDVENLQIIHDEQANLVLEDLAKDFKVENSSPVDDDKTSEDSMPEEKEYNTEKALKIINSCSSEVKANGAKSQLSQIKQKLVIEPSAEMNLEMQINVDSLNSSAHDDTQGVDGVDDVTSPSLKLKFKSTFDGKNKTWHACDKTNEIEDAVYYLSSPKYDNEFKKFVTDLADDQLDIEVDNLVVEMEYPECYDHIFTSLGAKIVRKRLADDSKTSPIKYNSEIITKRTGDNSIMLRIKKTREMLDRSENPNSKSKKRKIDIAPIETHIDVMKTTDILSVVTNVTPVTENKKAPVKRKNEPKRKTLGIKRSLVSSVTTNSLKLKLTTTEPITTDSDLSMNEPSESPVVDKPKSTAPKKLTKAAKKAKEIAAANANHKKSESESSDGRRSSISSTGNTHPKANDGTPVAAKNKKNATSNDSPNDVATPKATDQPKKPNDAKSIEERRKQSIMNCYYDQSDLYKPRPSVRLTSRRYQLNNAENT